MADRGHVPSSSGPNLYGADRIVMPRSTGAELRPTGECPSCRLESHPGRTCNGLTSAQIVTRLWPKGGR